jgi:hypothetical protein
VVKLKNAPLDNKELWPKVFCIHTVAGRTVIPKTCIFNHECQCCAFDQWLEEIDLEVPVAV